MKKPFLPFLVLCLALALPAAAQETPVFAWPTRWEGRLEYRPYLEQMQQLLEPLADTPIGDFTPAQVHRLALDLSVPVQKIRFIERSRTASFILPGSGQFLNRDPLDGTLFLLSTLALTAGQLVGAYLLLPDDLQFNRLDYWDAGLATIGDRWGDHSLQDYAPAFGVLVAGMLLKTGLRFLSSAHAGRLAEVNVRSGKVTFQPRLLVPWSDLPGEWGNRGHHGGGMGLMGGIRF